MQNEISSDFSLSNDIIFKECIKDSIDLCTNRFNHLTDLATLWCTDILLIFETNSSFHVKRRILGKVQFLFFRRFLLTKFSFEEEDWALAMVLWSFAVFVIFRNFLRSWVFSRLTTREVTRTYQFITNNHASFHLRWKENLLYNQKTSKYYEDVFISSFNC